MPSDVFETNSSAETATGRIIAPAVMTLCSLLCGLFMYAVVSLMNERTATGSFSEEPHQTAAQATDDRPKILPVSYQLPGTPAEEEPTSEPAQVFVTLPRTRSAVGEVSPVPSEQRPLLRINLSQVDEIILKGNYPFAADLLRDIERSASGLLRVRIQLRRALCAELEGDTQAALSHYRQLSETHQSSAVADAATIATARVLIDRGDHDVGTSMLMKLLLSRERTLHRDLRGDVVHMLAGGLVPPQSQTSVLHESRWLTAQHAPSPEEVLSRWSLVKTEQSLLVQPAGCSVRQLTDAPEGIFVSLQFPSADILSVLRQISGKLRWSTDIPPQLTEAMSSRTMILNCEELPLDIVLDGLLNPIGLDWTFRERRIAVLARSRVDSVSEQDRMDHVLEPQANAELFRRLETAERFQQLAVSLAPEHAAAPVSYILLGTSAARRGSMERAVSCFETAADLFPRSPVIGVTTFNLAKAKLLQGYRDEALKYFFRTVDRITGLQTGALAQLYIGRILLENDNPEQAISPLMRGLALADGTDYEAPAALLLAEAYLLDGNPNAANTVLLTHHSAFELSQSDDPAVATERQALVSRAALISSLARFWGSRGTQRIREGRAVLTALANPESGHSFGGHSAYLTGLAFAAVGLDAERDAVFRRSLAGTDRFPLQRRMHAVLNGELTTEVSFGPAADVINEDGTAGMPAGGNPSRRQLPTAHHQMLNRAEAAHRNGQHDEVLAIGRKLLDKTSGGDANSQIRRSVLRLMALSFQGKGQHSEAVLCLTGTPPAPDESSDPKEKQLP